MRHLLGDGLLYLLSVMMPGIIGMAMLPVTTRLLGPREYGLLELCAAMILITTCIATLELPQGLARYLPVARTLEERRAIGSTTLVFCILSLSGIGFFGVLLARIVPSFAAILPDEPGIWPAFGLTLVCSGVQAVAVRHLRWSFRPRAYLVATLLASFTTAACTLFFLLHWRCTATSILLAQAAGALASSLFTLILARGELRLYWCTASFGRLIAFSSPFVVSTLGLMATTQAGRILVAKHLGLEEAGRLGLALRITGILSLATTAFQMTVSPIIYSRHEHPLTPSWIASGARILAFSGLSLWVVLSECSSPIVQLVAGTSFLPSAKLIPLLSAALLLSSFLTFFPGMELKLHSRTSAAISVVTGATSFLLTLFLLPRLGIIGAATAPFLATLLQSYLVVRQSQKLYPVPHRWPPLVLAAGLACLPVTLAFIAPTSSPAVLMLKLSVDALILLFLARLLKIPVELRTWLSAVHRPSL